VDVLTRFIRTEILRPMAISHDPLPERVILIGTSDLGLSRFRSELAAARVETRQLLLTADGWSDESGGVFALDRYDVLASRLTEMRKADAKTPILFLTPTPISDRLAQWSEEAWTGTIDRNAAGVFSLAKAIGTLRDARAAHGHLGVILTGGASPTDVAAR